MPRTSPISGYLDCSSSSLPRKYFAYHVGVAAQILFLDQFDSGARRHAGYRIASESCNVAALVAARDFRSRNRQPDRHAVSPCLLRW